jgi:hypothetical protein
VIVSETLLKALKIPAETSPATLRVRSVVSGRPVSVPVVGVCREDLPLGHYFVMNDAYERKLRSEDPDAPARTIRTGPIPDTWPERDKFPPELRRALMDFELLAPRRETIKGKTVWVLTSSEQKPPLRSQWRILLEGLRDSMTAGGFPSDPGFVRVDAPSEGGEAKPRVGGSMGGIYVRDLKDLRPAAEVARKFGFRPNDDIIRQIEGIERSFQNIVVLLTVLAVIVFGLSFWNMTVIQELRSQQKITEIGMLKAMGMDDRLLRQIFLTEGAIVWVLGALLGVVPGLGRGLRTARMMRGDPNDPALAFVCPWSLLVSVIAVAGVACLVSTLLATRAARRASPIETLSTN